MHLPSLVVLLLPAAAEPVDYARDVKPIFKQRCVACHGALAQKGKLRLDAGTLILKGGRKGPAVRPGDSAGSLLLERISDTDDGSRMPPEGAPLSAEQIAKIKEWIDQGAKFPPSEKPEADPREHWAFRPIVRPALPAVKNTAWVSNPIDAFIAAEQEKHGLTPVGPADKATLLRRVHLDLIGLPPTRDELHAFLADHSTDAYEKVVDRLLSRPEHGERWARHWMDVWRYSDWYGRRAVPDNLNSYGMIWRWRDWIVNSLNEDRGYDWMVRMMLAADELAPGDDANAVATGFIVRNFYRWNYNQWMKEQVEHTGKAFLGLTLNCCQCHDHKYDPIKQEEYFKFRAFFEPVEIRHDRVPGEPDPGPYEKYVYAKSYGPMKSGLVRIMDEKLDAKTFFYTGGEERNIVKDKPPIPPGGPAFLAGDHLKIEPVNLPLTSSHPGLKPFVLAEETAKAQAAVDSTAAAAKPGRALTTALDRAAVKAGIAARAYRPTKLLQQRFLEVQEDAARARLAALSARIAAEKGKFLGEGDIKALALTAGKAERVAALATARVTLLQAEQAIAAARSKPGTDAKAKAEKDKADKQFAAASTAVLAAEQAAAEATDKYTPLGPVYPNKSTGRRAALARWLTDRNHPLTARVAVNHLWGWHIGRPIVESTFDLGRNGKKPSHPALLDWLAAELMDNGWQMKHLHRLIVTSNAYRLASAAPLDHPDRVADPDNRYLWRFTSTRLEAEVVRDGILSAAGSLDPKRGGPDVPHEQGLTVPRRSLYFAHHGEAKMEFLALFDGANACDCYCRSTSVMPQQALALSNSELALRQSRLLARRLATPGLADTAFVPAAFEQVLSRPPSDREQAAALAFLSRQATLFRTTDAKELASTATAASDAPATDPALRAKENFIHALFNHTDFVTVR